MNTPNTIHENQLAAKVAARNRVNSLLPKVQLALGIALTPFLGKKLLTVNGTLTAKAAESLRPVVDAMEKETGAFICFSPCNHSVRYYVKVCEVFPSRYPGTTIASYAEASVDVAELAGMMLSQIYSGTVNPRADYTVAEIKSARAEVAAARTALSLAQSKLAGFGEFEN